MTPCSDGSLCCNNDPQCCQDGKGIFLDEGGERISARATAATTSYGAIENLAALHGPRVQQEA